MSERTEALMRIVVGIISGLILGIWQIAVKIISIINGIYVISTNERHVGMAEFCNRWNTQAYKYIRYLTFASNERPFPFTDLGKDILPYDKKK